MLKKVFILFYLYFTEFNSLVENKKLCKLKKFQGAVKKIDYLPKKEFLNQKMLYKNRTYVRYRYKKCIVSCVVLWHSIGNKVLDIEFSQNKCKKKNQNQNQIRKPQCFTYHLVALDHRSISSLSSMPLSYLRSMNMLFMLFMLERSLSGFRISMQTAFFGVH